LKIIFPFCIILIFPLFCCAQPIFSPEKFILSGEKNIGGAESILLIDMDEDGDQDVLSYGGSKVAWYENEDGFGAFGTQRVIINLTSNMEDLDTVDWDSDGLMDLLVAYEDNTIAWFQNLGDGTSFGAPQVLTTEQYEGGLWSIKAVDMDVDGDLDILAAQAFDDQIYWYEREGLTIDTSRNIIVEGIELVKELSYIDIDGDNLQDIVTYSSHRNEVYWLKNLNGAGSFSGLMLIASLSGITVPDFKDFDGDGDLDMLTSSWSQDLIGWYENEDGLGDFSNFKIFENSIIEPYSTFGGDIDGDNDLDAIVLAREANILYWYENVDGQADFENKRLIDHPIRSNKGGGFFYDIDQDSDQDLFFMANNDSKIILFENEDGAGDFGTQQLINKGGQAFRSLIETDINGDDKEDLLMVDYGGRFAYFTRESGVNYSQQEVLLPEPAVEISLSDLNGDTLPDIVGVSAYRKSFYELTNLDGMGGYDYNQTIVEGLDTTSTVKLADLDGDGDQDILAYKFSVLSWFKNEDGVNQFSAPILIEEFGASRNLGSIIGGEDKVIWFENEDGQGNFSEEQIITDQLDGATSVSALDMDGDNDMDIIAGSYSTDRVVWYENEGAGVF